MTVPSPDRAPDPGRPADQRDDPSASQAETRLHTAQEPEPSTMDRQLIGRTLLGCEIQSIIGRGAAGTVFLARHLQIDCLRAIKVLKPELARDPETVERFRSEARSAAGITHENLVTLHNADQQDGYFAYVMEYVEGQTLTQRVQDAGPLDPDEAVALLCQVCGGLSAAHHAGITHRDIKPENLLLTASGQIKVADFGLARTVDSQQLTQQGQVVGTPPYMSPEQCQNHPIDPRSDIYSLGLVGYYLLTGTEPMRGDNVMATMYNQVHQDPEPLHRLRPAIGAALSEVICRMLAKNPAARQPDTETVIQELLASRARAPRPSGRIVSEVVYVQPISSTASAPVRARLARLLLRCLPALIVGLTAGWLLRAQRPQAPLVGPPSSKRQAPVQPDLIPHYIRAIERDDLPAAFGVLTRHLARHPRDWSMRSKRIALARQLERILEAYPDLQALDEADRLSDQETRTLLNIYLKLDRPRHSNELMQRIVRRNPTLAAQLEMDRTRKLLAAGKTLAAARAWLQSPRETDPGSLFLETLKQALDRLTEQQGKPSAELNKLLLELFQRDPRFFHWPTLSPWFAADLRRVEQLTAQVVERVFAESCRDKELDAVCLAAGKVLRTKDRDRARHLAQEAWELGDRAQEDRLHAKAVRHYTHSLALMPWNHTTWYKRGKSSWVLRNDEHALVDLAMALGLQPLDYQTRFLRGRILRDRGQYTKAIRDFTAAIKIGDRMKASVWVDLQARAYCYLLAKQPGKARADFKRALKLHASRLSALGLAIALAETGERAAAQATLRKLLISRKIGILARDGRARIYLKIAARLIAILPRYPLAHAERGLLRIKSGNHSEAIRDFERGLALCTGVNARYRRLLEAALAAARSRQRKKKR